MKNVNLFVLLVALLAMFACGKKTGTTKVNESPRRRAAGYQSANATGDNLAAERRGINPEEIKNQNNTVLSKNDKNEIIDSLIIRMKKYAEALNQQNSELVLGNYSKEGDFILFADGKFLTYSDMVPIAQSLNTLKSLFVTWDTIVITPLTKYSALATAPFHRIIVDISGKETKDWGTANWAWTKRNGKWFMVYGHANHYPEVSRIPANK